MGLWSDTEQNMAINTWKHLLQHKSVTNLQLHNWKENEIMSWHLSRASFCTPSGVCRSETWKFRMSMSEAPNLAWTWTFSYRLKWTGLDVIASRVLRKRSRSSERTRCSSSRVTEPASVPDDAGIVVGHSAMYRGELGSNPRLLGSGPLGRRRTLTGVFIVLSQLLFSHRWFYPSPLSESVAGRAEVRVKLVL